RHVREAPGAAPGKGQCFPDAHHIRPPSGNAPQEALMADAAAEGKKIHRVDGGPGHRPTDKDRMPTRASAGDPFTDEVGKPAVQRTGPKGKKWLGQSLPTPFQRCIGEPEEAVALFPASPVKVSLQA